jgi:ATP-dependent HslUV protease ATP-binding subunit HslU
MNLNNYEPKKVVKELNRYIIGQDKAKKIVAIALRNRWRRKQLSLDLQRDIYPKNIIMIGPTGVGKTEIARRLSSITSSPFLKIEASKFTEVGYMGRDVESMVRDLIEIAVNMVKKEQTTKVEKQAQQRAKKRIINFLMGKTNEKSESENESKTQAFITSKFEKGEFDEKEIEIDVEQMIPLPKLEYITNQGVEEIDMSISDMFKNLFPKGKKKKRRMKIKKAYELFIEEEKNKMINTDDVIMEARDRTENEGIIFIDELDKIAGNYGKGSGPDVSREGVQRDLLPIVEGTKVTTRYGIIDTAHILFIGAGAFNVSTPSDLIPELQGRFPLRVELNPLTAKDFERILKEPENSLIKQYKALLQVENLELDFTNKAIEKIANIAYELNQTAENIGARRLFTIMEYLLEDISFKSPYKRGTKFALDDKFVENSVKDFSENEDLSNYIL